MLIEEGYQYWRRDGGVSGPLRETDNGWFTDGVLYWRFDGRYQSHQETKYDLIAEYIDQQPLEWKRGIPTAEECRECFLICGGDGKKPFTVQIMCHGPSVTRQTHWGANHWYLALRIKPVEPPKPKTVTQRQYISETREELWTQHDVANCWKPTGLTREVPA